MFHEYPYTDFHELNLDYLMKLARESLGLHLAIQGKDLALVNAAGQNVSKVRVAFATTAEKDEEGNDIVAYVFDAGLDGRALVFTKGDGSSESIVIPFATTAEKDVNNKDITSYVSRVGVSGNKILVTFGDGTTYSFTCPYANKAGQAETDENGKNLTTYMADVEVSGNNLVFKDGEGVTLRTITVSYATEAGTAEKASKDLQGNAFLSTYGYQLSIDGNKIGIDSHDGTTINKITVPFSTLSTDATNAIETVTINGNDIIFSTYGGQQFTITCPFAVKAQKDDLGNNIKNTYVANVTTNPNTGAITFLDAQGNTIVTITPTVDAATHDALGNTISDYVKAIAVSASSNYVTVTHGDGDVDTLTINYSTHAFKDLNNQSIHNTYCTLLACEEDVQDGHYKLVGYNGDVPVAEIFRITLIADAAKHDSEGNVISEFYGHSLDYDSTGDKVSLLDANGNVLSYINIDDATGSVINNIVENASTGKVSSMDIDGTTYDFIDDTATTLSDLSDVDTTGIVTGDVLAIDKTVSPEKWIPVTLYNPVGSWVLYYTTRNAANTNVAAAMSNTGNVFTESGIIFDRAENVRTGVIKTSNVSIDDMLKEGPVMVIIRQAVGNVTGMPETCEGFITEKTTSSVGAYRHYLYITPKIEYLYSNGVSELDGIRMRLGLNDDASVLSVSNVISSPMFTRFTAATKQLSNVVFTFSDGTFTEDSTHCIKPHLLFKYMLNGSPLPQLIINDGGTNVYVTPKNYKIFKGNDEQILPTFSSIVTKMWSNITSVYTIHVLYENVTLSDGNTYSIDATYTVQNKTMVQQATNTYNDFEYSNVVTLTATVV